MADNQITPFQLTDQFTMDNFNQRINETNTALADICVGQDGTVYSTAGNAVRAQVTQLKQDLNKVVKIEPWNLLTGKTPIEKWFIDTATGVGRALNDFFAFTDIDVSDLTGNNIFIYSSKIYGTAYTCRNVVFYDSNGDFISGIGGNNNVATNGYPVPSNASTMGITFIYETTAGQIKPETYYASRNAEHKDIVSLNEDVSISIGYLDDVDLTGLENGNILKYNSGSAKWEVSDDQGNISIGIQPVQLIRKPTFSFVFDDGTDGDVNTKALFDSYGFKCGFAILANSGLTNKKGRYLGYQNDGFEILSHSVDGVKMQDGTLTVSEVEAKFKDSLDTLTSAGFNVTGWVTPSTWLNSIYFDALCKYYQYGFGHLDTAPSSNPFVHTFAGHDIRQLERESLQTNTVEQIISKIDANISGNGYMCFYGHSYPSDNMTVENMNTILTYLKTKSDEGEIIVDIPRNAINNYYAMRHSDYLALLN